MSTRAIIHIYDKFDGFNLYIHGDGGSDTILPKIQKAKEFSWKLPRFEAGEFATALIKVLKRGAGGVYLINATEEIVDTDFYYQVFETNGELIVKVSHLKR